VRRNETIMVISRAAGVQVRTNAKAIEDGAKGDSIVVEELEGKVRHRYNARVSGFQEAEIFAGVTNVVSNPQPR
jgi:flagella basal body P-ring formation protein FlgA